MAKTMTEKAMVRALEGTGAKVVTLQCSGYLRLNAFFDPAKVSPVGERDIATVETVDCSLPEARARLVAAVKKVVGQ